MQFERAPATARRSRIGWILLLVFWSERGTPGENRFGPPPG
ncbi:hypothetical protein [Amycolatopsis sp. NBRC 101858]|nr:hypothetical protein [Amycolatopsis sp. NBRC 101858]